MSITKLWNQASTWLATHQAELLQSFCPGASDEELQKLADTLGTKLPKDFVEFYKIHNGQDTGLVFGSAFLDPDSEGLSPISKILSVHALYSQLEANAPQVDAEQVPQAVQALFWNKKWLPIIEDGFGNSYFIDLDPSPKGKKGQIVLRMHEGPSYELIAKSFRAWMKEFIEANFED